MCVKLLLSCGRMRWLSSGLFIVVVLLVLLILMLRPLVRNVSSNHQPAMLVSTVHDYSRYFIGTISRTVLLPSLWFHEKYRSEGVSIPERVK
jgi:hypothetical protein